MAKKKAAKKVPQKHQPLKVNMTFEELLKMAANTPPKKKQKKWIVFLPFFLPFFIFHARPKISKNIQN